MSFGKTVRAIMTAQAIWSLIIMGITLIAGWFLTNDKEKNNGIA
jgi:hypothetical protein